MGKFEMFIEYYKISVWLCILMIVVGGTTTNVEYLGKSNYILSGLIQFLVSSSGSLRVCHCAIGRLGEANMSDQCRSSVPVAL